MSISISFRTAVDDTDLMTSPSTTTEYRVSELELGIRALMTDNWFIAQIFSHTPCKTKSPRCANTAGKGKGQAPLEIELNSKLHSSRISYTCYNTQATM